MATEDHDDPETLAPEAAHGPREARTTARERILRKAQPTRLYTPETAPETPPRCVVCDGTELIFPRARACMNCVPIAGCVNTRVLAGLLGCPDEGDPATLLARVRMLREEHGDGARAPAFAPHGDHRRTLREMRYCAASWAPEARIIGNVRAGDIAAAIDDWLDARDVLLDKACGFEMEAAHACTERDAARARIAELEAAVRELGREREQLRNAADAPREGT